MKYHIGPEGHGVAGDLLEALADANAPAHTIGDYEEVSREEYEETVLDRQWEDGEWTQ